MSKRLRTLLAVSLIAGAFAVHPATAASRPVLPTPSIGSEYFTAENGHLTYHGPSQPRATFGQQMRLAALGKQSPLDALRNVQRQSLLASPNSASASTQAGPPSAGSLTPVGDLDGDGVNDVVRLINDRSNSNATVSAYRGVDGKLLWTQTESNSSRTAVFPIHVGQDASNGVLVVMYSCTTCSLADQTSLTLTALRGNGTTAWTRTFTGDVADAFVAGSHYQAPIFGGLLDARRNAPTSVLVGSYTWVSAGFVVGAFVESFDAIVVSGVDGSTRSTMSTGPLVNTSNYLFPAGALSGNGRDDYIDLQFVGNLVTAGLSLAGVSSSSGQQLWTTPVNNWTGSVLLNAGDTTGSGHDDVLLTNAPYYIGGQGYLRSSLVNGATGEQLWSLPLDVARPIGDVNGDGKADIGAESVLYDYTTLGARYDAIDGSGATIYSTPYAATAAGNWVGTLTLLPNAGDVNGDGHSDAGHDVAMADFDTDTMTLDRGIVSGTNGAKLWSGRIGLAAGGPIGGPGSDLIRLAWASPQQDSVAVTTVSGANGATLWQQTVALAPFRQFLASWTTSDVDGDGGGDLFLGFAAGGDSAIVLRGSDGSELPLITTTPTTTTTTHHYDSANGAAVWSGVIPSSCDPQASQSSGGACFALRGAGSFSVVINDVSNQPVTGNYEVYDGGGSPISSGSFCGSIANVPTTVDATELIMWIGPVNDALNVITGQSGCSAPDLPTTGSVTATVTG